MLVGVVAIAATGCAASNGSLIENGERVETGRRRFDDYFADVQELKRKVDDIDADLFKVREPLIEALDHVKVDASLPELMKELRKAVKKLKDYGVTLNLTITPAPKIRQIGERERDEGEDTLIFAIERSAQSAFNEFTRFQQMLQVTFEMDDARAKLADKIDGLPLEVDRDLIETEIVGAGRVLKGVRKKLLGYTRTMSHFLIALAAASDTAAEEDLVACKEPEKKKKKSSRGRARRGRGPARPPAKKPPPPPAGGDFDM